MLRIDSHQHFWKLDRGDYSWLTPDLTVLYRDFLPDDLVPEITKAEICKTILVQAAPARDETNYLLNLADSTDFIAGVVGWVDLEKDNVDDEISALSASPYFLGIRPMLQDIPDLNWVLQPKLQTKFDKLASLDLTFDALVKPQHLESLYTLLRRHPDLQVVIDHGAKPNIAEDQYQHWSQQMRRIAAATNAYCKLSGFVTEAGHDHSQERLQPYIDHLIQCFGPDRLMWGSDWPVVNIASSYSDWIAMTEKLLAPLNQEDRDKIMGGTAQTFYRLRFSDSNENNAIAVQATQREGSPI